MAMEATSMTAADVGVESASTDASELVSPFATRPVQFFLVGLVVSGILWAGLWLQRPGSVPVTDSIELRIDLNQATIQEISLMPGIGDVLARRILRDRQTCGPFLSIDDVARVPGIGPKTLAQIESMCHVTTSVPSDRLASQPK